MTRPIHSTSGGVIGKWRLPNNKKPLTSQQGMALVVVLMLLVIVSVLGVAAMRITMMAERSARNDRDMQVALQAAEEALLDAELDISSKEPDSRGIFLRESTQVLFIDGCGNSSDGDKLIGLCELRKEGKPAWLTVDFEDDQDSARSAALGHYTGRTFASGSSTSALLGVRPSRTPRYVIEGMDDPLLCRDRGKVGCGKKVYRVTSMGFGPRPDIQAVVQVIYRY